MLALLEPEPRQRTEAIECVEVAYRATGRYRSRLLTLEDCPLHELSAASRAHRMIGRALALLEANDQGAAA
jgi:hypothetical protein